MSVMVEVSWGELVDKVTILQIKLARIRDPAKLANVERELAALGAARAEALARSPRVAELEAELRRTNEVLWDNEDRLRDLERAKDYGPAFVECARAAYRTNDRRAALKRELNDLLGSALVEEKSYARYE
jgi:hypothetical protein